MRPKKTRPETEEPGACGDNEELLLMPQVIRYGITPGLPIVLRYTEHPPENNAHSWDCRKGVARARLAALNLEIDEPLKGFWCVIPAA